MEKKSVVLEASKLPNGIHGSNQRTFFDCRNVEHFGKDFLPEMLSTNAFVVHGSFFDGLNDSKDIARNDVEALGWVSSSNGIHDGGYASFWYRLKRAAMTTKRLLPDLFGESMKG